MCGICGFNSNDPRLARDMAGIINHRGPDSEGFYSDIGISLGFRRLSIIDLSRNGNQPMFTEDNNAIIVFNGEIYNFLYLRKKLQEKGYRFRSNTDTEVILSSYEEYGEKCVDFLDGMFAFAIWDKKKKKLFLARDRLGVKPLYYYYDKNTFVFASEIKSILLHPLVRTSINKKILNQIINYAYPVTGETLFYGIKEVEPGNTLIFSDGLITIARYWNLQVNESSQNLDYFIKAGDKLLNEAIKKRLISDVSLGATLSGGIDSSTMVAIASKFSSKPLKTVTVGFGIPEDEYEKARIVAKHCGTDHVEARLSADDLLKAFAKVVWHLEIPFARPAILAVYYLAKNVKRHLTVSLVGEGADEIFAGYNRYDAYTALPKKTVINSTNQKEFYRKLKEKINMEPNRKAAYISSGVFTDDREAFFKNNLLKFSHNEASTYFEPLIKNLPNNGKQLNQALLYEIKTEIPYYQCNKIDKMSMAHSHEMREPYLDYRLVEFSLTIPSIHKFVGLEKKIILQHIARKYLPKEIVKGRKLPLVVPLSKVFKNQLLDLASSLLTEDRLRKKGFCNQYSVIKHIKSLKSGKKSDDQSYRQLLFFTTLDMWERLFLENPIKTPHLNINDYF